MCTACFHPFYASFIPAILHAISHTSYMLSPRQSHTRHTWYLLRNSRFHVTRGDFVVIAPQPIRIRGKIVSHNLRQSSMLLYEDLSRYACFYAISRLASCAWENWKSDSRYLKRIFGGMFIPVSYRKLSCNACVRQRWQSKTAPPPHVCLF
jgi:hypothetical protein